MPRSRTQKQVAKRIDMAYFKRLHPARRLRRGLIVFFTLLAVAWIGISAVRVRNGKIALVDSIHNPGPVVAAHAMIGNDCRACHSGDGKGGFKLSVTDEACLKCHDGSLHDANQKIAQDDSTVSRESLTLAIADSHHPAGAHSAGCATCHVEHRTEAALLGSKDQNCIFCHKDVQAASAAHPKIQNEVISFAPSQHPRFGRSLAVNDKWVDPTKLQFNHAYHFGKKEELKNCSVCHATEVPMKFNTKESQMPPFARDDAKSTIPARQGAGGYMRPVSYAEHCSGCHELKFEAVVSLRHVDLTLTRSQLADLSTSIRLTLAKMSPEDQQKALTPSAPSSGRGRRGPAPTPVKPDEWVKTKLGNAIKEATDWAGDKGESNPRVKAVQSSELDEVAKNSAFLEAYVVFGISNSCVKCHEINGGTMPGLMPTTAPAEGATTQPSMLLATLPTGIGDTPRHWFGNSSFDHRAHRDISCVDCHRDALISGKETATATMDFLSPDLDHVAVAGKNCINCHRPGGSSVAAAPASCVTCHVYHDRTKERPMDSAAAQ